MNKILKTFFITILSVGILTGCGEADKSKSKKQITKKTEVKKMTDNKKLEIVVATTRGKELGTMTIELWNDVAPKHVERITKLATEGFYNGLTFHRVIEGFMVQGGCPLGTGTGGSELPDLQAEFNDKKHTRGVLSMARSASPDSANSQFFIMLDNATHLDGQYTAFGKVIDGIDTLDKIKRGDQSNNGTVTEPSVMKSVKVI